jgi:3-isopropylmalate/(R)-2-methylmalate dehydratase small subunit
MEPFIRLTASAVPLPQANVDTDQIIPARFLSKPMTEMAKWAFHDLRFDANEAPRPGFPLNDPTYREARILVARENFGCGSSREHAVWALMNSPDPGLAHSFRCVIAPSYGEIFRSNACKNGLLPVALPASVVEDLLAQLATGPARDITVDLERQVVRAPNGQEHAFEFDTFQRECLLRGVDDIDLTLELEAKISHFEQQQASDRPWLAGPKPS